MARCLRRLSELVLHLGMKQALMPSVVHHAHANLRLRHQHLQLSRQGTDQRRTDAWQRFSFGSGSVVAPESNVKGHMAPLLITKGHWLHGDLRRGGGS